MDGYTQDRVCLVHESALDPAAAQWMLVCVNSQFATLSLHWLLQLQEAVVDSHKANAGYVSSGSSGNMALLVMQWFLKPLMDAIM